MSVLSPAMIGEQLRTYPELLGEDLPRLLDQPCDLPSGVQRVYAVGNGDSFHACLCAGRDFSRWSDVQYVPMPAYTFLHCELPALPRAQAEKSLVICVSASGSSKMAVRILEEARRSGMHTLSLTGREDCAMNDAAALRFSAVIPEKGRTPGLRTFAASYGGLLRLSALLGGQEAACRPVQSALKTAAASFPAWLDQSQAAVGEAAAWDWPCASVIGCGRLEGAARFSAAKLTEGAGLFAVGQEMEEWCHVESMAYPLHAPLILLLSGDGDQAQAVKAAGTARRAGRKVLLIGAGPADQSLADAADRALFFGAAQDAALLPLLLPIPCAALAQALAEKEGRGMFLSDQPIRLF